MSTANSGPRNLLITGNPGCGKTTLVRRLVEGLPGIRACGFYTAEIREGGMRKGFELVGLDGRRGLLSHVDLKGPFRVGKYGVDVRGFEAFLESIDFLGPATELIVIDEVGKMECYSRRFTRLLSEILTSEKAVLATIAQRGGGIIAAVKERADIKLFELTRSNRESLFRGLLQEAYHLIY